MRLVLLLAVAVTLPACMTGVAASPPGSTGWTVGTVDLASSGVGSGRLEAVRAARHEEYDRIAFEFDRLRPAVSVAYVDRPVRRCGSGDVVELAGDGWLEIRFEGARAHDEFGQPTAAPPRRELGLPNVQTAVQTCDFEGVVTWVVAAESPEAFRVISLDGPPRVAVDIRHPVES